MDGNLGIQKEVIKDAYFVSRKAGEKPGELEITGSSSPVIVGFPGSRSPEDWFPEDSKANPFGKTKIDLEKFPSLRRIGNGVPATVNRGFMARFERILQKSGQTIRNEAADEKKQIIFTGHSSGGPIAIYATVWSLEEHRKSKKKETPPVFCLTFGSPLTTDHIFGHAIRREGWSDNFVHFVTKLDIIPRVLLAPAPSTGELLKEVASFIDPDREPDSIGDLTSFFVNVRKHASCVANHAACALTGSKNTLFDTMSKFIKLSPYRPCGKYVFCTETGASVVLENPDAVLQLLFYSLQNKPKTELQKIAVASLRAHWAYEDALDKSLATPIVVCLDNLRELPLSSDRAALIDLNLCASARLCLRAAGESEKKKLDNLEKIKAKKDDIEKALGKLEEYRTARRDDVGYYDAFKLYEKTEDLKANVVRLELAAIWDEIIEMIRQEELPEKFEAEETWVKLGTRFRRLVEPIDIANYYRHSRQDTGGPYMKKGSRPSRYKYTQGWREHAEQLENGSCGESCFWAEVEELNLAFADNKLSNEQTASNKQTALKLAEKLEDWHGKGEVEEDAFLKETTLAKWCQTLPNNYEAKYRIQGLIVSQKES
ncbi:protein EDS1L-like isoform X2 [Rhodamnia argentea]|uniref:Protein EDS1L-like isoform X2 n=1 Tax=Rhodamnia argentea TaxID=178133 RepID=A0A8B8P753_9MYRT|nr:protein EDS1L-like isoform X2 [Rhodamnia argentea]